MKIEIEFLFKPKITNYYHFLKDYCAQLYFTLNEKNIFNEKIIIHFKETPEQYKNFLYISEFIFPDISYSLEKFDNPDLFFQFDYFGKYGYLKDFSVYVTKKISFFLLSPSWKTDILLIEREETTKKFKFDTNSVRLLGNHEDLKKKLEIFCKEKNLVFRNLRLSDEKFQYQIAYFKNAKVVIGQHGAGLLNLIWMRPYISYLIEITHVFGYKHFHNTFLQIKRAMFFDMSGRFNIQYMHSDPIKNNVANIEDILTKINAIYK